MADFEKQRQMYYDSLQVIEDLRLQEEITDENRENLRQNYISVAESLGKKFETLFNSTPEPDDDCSDQGTFFANKTEIILAKKTILEENQNKGEVDKAIADIMAMQQAISVFDCE